MKTIQTIYNFVIVMMFAMFATSCSDKNLYDTTAIEQQKKAEFTENFIKKYGEISATQSWDFSSGVHNYTLSAPKTNARKTVTRANANPADYMTIGDWYQVDLNTVGWLRSTLTESTDHRTLGNPFYMEVPGNVFSIVPIFEGQASYVWTLHVVVDDYDGTGESLDIKVWTKHENIQKKSNAYSRWSNVTSDTSDAYAVQAKPIILDLREFKGKRMYLYLENKYNNKTQAPASSLDHQMLALDIPVDKMPANIDESYKKVIIACEDNADGKNFSIDYDYNDVVFMIYGNPAIPEIKEVEEIIYDSFSKRYMIEDLGTTDDFDFNDVVVDVYDLISKKAIYDVDADGNKTFRKWEDEVHTQEAIIRSLGGTLDITVKIGSTEWTKSDEYLATSILNTGVDGPVDYSAELAKFTIKDTDWDAETNNVSAIVGEKTSENVLHIVFPKVGEAPMIIGFDADDTRNWMYERQSIPLEWFTE